MCLETTWVWDIHYFGPACDRRYGISGPWDLAVVMMSAFDTVVLHCEEAFRCALNRSGSRRQ